MKRPARRRLAHAGLLMAGVVLVGIVTITFQALSGHRPRPIQASDVAPARSSSISDKRSKQADPMFRKKVRPFLQKFCAECHGPKTQNGGLRFDRYADVDSLLKDRKQFEKALRLLKLGAMPPFDHEVQPEANEREEVVGWLDKLLFDIDCRLVRDPGRVTIRRLNRAEYNNTIRDLLLVDFSPADDFPSDDVGEGFDNIGDVLSLSPLLMEKYLDAAEAIADKAIVIADSGESRTRAFRGKQLSVTGAGRSMGNGSFSLYSRGTVGTKVTFEHDGEYVLRAEASADQAGPAIAKMELRLDGKAVKTFEVKGNRTQQTVYEHRLKVAAGSHRVDAAFINDYYKPTDPDPKNRDRNLYVHRVEVSGPINLPPDALPASHRRLITCRPDAKHTPADCARKILRPFMTRAFRRPITDEELERHVSLVNLAIKEGDTFDEAMRLSVQGVLVSPFFLFRYERAATPDDPTTPHPISDHELATRLSYFLWSTMPDDQLFELAKRQQLRKLDVLEAQVRRMLKDPRSRAMVDNFASQWLNLRVLDETTPDPKRFPEFNDDLRRDMRTETELLFEAVMREDRSILDLLDARFTFINERMATLYGIAGVKGPKFRRVDLPAGRRAGVLTHASILTLTSNATRTSPVKRGKWIMENILDTPPPPPPPDVPEFEESVKASPDASLREQLELHRKNPQCAICHRQMDAIGFGFENFDAIGRWRDTDGKHKIDASGTLPGRQSFRGAHELIGILRKREGRFCRSLSRKLLTYGLGRGLEFYDRCAVDKIVEESRGQDYRFSALVIAIVHSEPFRLRRGEGENE